MSSVATRVLTAVFLVPVMFAAACAGPDGDDPEGATTGTSATEDAFPVTIDHEFGSTTIESGPDRVVAVGVADADPAIALGVVPVANSGYAYYDTGLGPWTDELVDESELTWIENTEQNFEAIASVEPDLILAVTSGIDQQEYDRLTQIAPTVARPAGTEPYQVDRSEVTTTIASALGKPEEGDELNEEIDTLLRDVQHEYPQFVGKKGVVGVVVEDTGGISPYLPGDARGRFLTALGFELPDAVHDAVDAEAEEGFYLSLSSEQIDLLDGDLLVIQHDDPDFDIVEFNSLAATLDVVQNEAVVTATRDERGAITYNSVLSIPYAVEHLVPRIASAMEDCSDGASSALPGERQ